MKCMMFAVSAILGLSPLMAAPHIRTIKGAVLTPDEGFLIGNGDLSCSIYQEADAIVFRLGKGDVWDRRVDATGCPRPVTVREFIDGVLKEGWTAKDWTASNIAQDASRVKDPVRLKEIFHGKQPCHNIAPRPKPTGEFRLFTHPDLPAPEIDQRLIIEEGRVELALRWPNGVKLRVEAVVDPDQNVLAVKWKADNWTDETRYGYGWLKPGPVWFGLMRWADPDWRDWTEKMAGRKPHWPIETFDLNTLPPLPPPASVSVDGWLGIEQRFQPDEDFPDGFAYRMFVLADKAKGTFRPNRYDREKEEWVHYLPKTGVLEGEVSIPVMTARDGNLDRIPAPRSYAERRAAAKKAAEAFWGKSALSVPGDPFLEDAWYAIWHTRRSVIRGGKAVPPGLFLPSTVDDFARWNGDYHGNYNMQSIFWGEMTADRLEEAEAFFEIVDYARPLGEKIARECYGCRGCFIQLGTYPVHTRTDPYGKLPLGRMAYMTGWAMTKYWQYYRYTRDRDWLRARGYPFMRDCALFYLDFLKKAPHPDLPPELKDGKYHVFPSVQGESGWKSPMDLCDRPQVLNHARWCLYAAAEAAKTLAVDADLVAQWTDRYTNLPDTPRAPTGDDYSYAVHCWWTMLPEFGAGSPWQPARTDPRPPREKGDDWYAYPGIQHFGKIQVARHNACRPSEDYPLWRESLARWMRPNGLVVAMSASRWARAGWTETFAAVAPFQDMLLWSFDGAIRIFPRWHEKVDVAFRDFRAEGAFLVSAAMTRGRVHGFRIRSLKGETCLVHGDWRVTDAQGSTVATDRDRFGRLRFKTVADGCYTLEAAR